MNKILLSSLGLLLAACAQMNLQTVALRDVTVVNVLDGSLRAEQTVLVTGNRITAIGRSNEIKVSDDAEVVDAAGRTGRGGRQRIHHSARPVRRFPPVPSPQSPVPSP